MKIMIPEEYKGYFKEKVFVVRWLNTTLLLMNEQDHQNLLNKLSRLKMGELDGFIRLIKAGLIECEFDENRDVEILDVIYDFLPQKPYKIRLESFGLVIFT